MSSLQRRVGMLILLALVIQPIALFAQQNSPITIVGSGIPAPLVQAIATTAKTTVNVSVTGSDDGFTAFCKGQADVALSTRAISASEEGDCTTSKVNFLEFVLGYDVMAVVANPGTDFGQCLTTAQLNSLFAPSTNVTNWNQVDSKNANIPLTLDVPPDNTSPYALLDSVVQGVGLRSDVTTLDSDTKIIDAVGSTKGALGVVNLPDALAAGSKVTILQLNTTTVGCAAPSADTAAGRTYSAVYPLYAYANSVQIDKVKALFTAAFSAASAATMSAQGFVAPTAADTTTDQQILTGVKTGRQFSKEVTAFTIPANLVGTINMAGAASGSDYMTAVTGAFTKAYAGVTLNQKVTGAPDGIRQLCNGTIDIVTDFTTLTPDQQKNCTANNIPTETITLANQAVVLTGNDAFATCLTTEQVTAIWSAAAEKKVTNWNQVYTKWPDLKLTLVAPTLGAAETDLLLNTAYGDSLPAREDVAETKDDPAYRAAAANNVAGGLTFMTWNEYQSLASDVQARAKLMSINSGKGCVAPSDQTISDETYPLSRPLTLIVNRLSMARQEVQSLLWYIASDDNYTLFVQNGYVGLGFDQLPTLRDTLQKDYAQAQVDAAAAASRAANATPEATAQSTPEATPAG